jgi:nicotinate-nucleotide adenylyltransferase
MKHIGLFFGSFNPLTNAHVALAKTAVNMGLVDESWFVLSPANPAKYRKNILADEEHRRQMLLDFVAHENDDTLKLCDIEYELPRPSYTHNTLKVLKDRHPDVEFHILCGSDTLAKILTWRTGIDVVRNNNIICFRRGDAAYEWPDVVLNSTLFIDAEIPDLSSTLVRGNISSGNAYNTMTPKLIADYIHQHGLYK